MNLAHVNLLFPVEKLKFVSGPDEEVIIGGRDQFPNVGRALKTANIKQAAVIGLGSQGLAQVQNLENTLKAVDCKDTTIVVGLRENSPSIPEANKAGFSKEAGTILTVEEAIKTSDLVIVLIPDGDQTENYQKFFDLMKSGATIGISHGFLEGFLSSRNIKFREDINVIMVAPKGMGPSVRNLYLQGAETGGSGINSSVAVHQQVNDNAVLIAAAWSVAIGSPVTFTTTVAQEWRSDLFGERAMLLGGMHALVEAMYNQFIGESVIPVEAFKDSVLAVTTFISPEISKLGLDGFYRKHIEPSSILVKGFELGYGSTYVAYREVMAELYEEVSTGREIDEVIRKSAELKGNPMSKIGEDPMWQVGESLLDHTVTSLNSASAMTAGALVAGIMAQFRILLDKGHNISEIINESLIEATDSLIPYMRARGIAWMVDNCSITARLGSRKWAPIFLRELTNGFANPVLVEADKWINDPIHQDVQTCYERKPKVAIVVST